MAEQEYSTDSEPEILEQEANIDPEVRQNPFYCMRVGCSVFSNFGQKIPENSIPAKADFNGTA